MMQIFLFMVAKTTQKDLATLNTKFVYRILDRKLIRVSYFEGINKNIPKELLQGDFIFA